jgi:hypothetical protein
MTFFVIFASEETCTTLAVPGSIFFVSLKKMIVHGKGGVPHFF